MKNTLIALTLIVTAGLVSPASAKECPDAFDTSVRKLHSKDNANLCKLYEGGKAMLVVNTASHCGFTKQFSGLEELHKKYSEQGLVVVGFPSDDFKQEEKDEADTARVCYENYGVSFVMFEHTAVKGENASPAFKYLATKTQKPSWNFNKYLIDAKGNVTHFSSMTKPLNSKLETAVQQALAI
ncbi:MAG TPA: glutathione peroxidase [Marinagarivorans sp.]